MPIHKITYLIVSFSLLSPTNLFAEEIPQAVLEKLRYNAAIKNYQEYLEAPNHKAFATTGEGSFGWISDAINAQFAIEDAMKFCNRYRIKGESECYLLNVDGKLRITD